MKVLYIQNIEGIGGSENYFLEASEEIKNSIVDFYEKQFENELL